MIPGKPPLDYSVEAENVEGHIRNCLALLDSDLRVGFWDRRRTSHAIRKRLLAALDLLERTP